MPVSKATSYTEEDPLHLVAFNFFYTECMHNHSEIWYFWEKKKTEKKKLGVTRKLCLPED